ncbi:MAG: cysteine desulfurase [Betaproteobacteria bacterium]|nr:cysteine desulfurase [Betaproteobacteria bacterium]
MSAVVQSPIVQPVRPRPQGYDVERLRGEFPILATTVHGKPLVYLDNGATTQKPLAVIAAEKDYYERCNANVHRGVHALSQRATEAYEAARDRVRRFINAASAKEIVFVRGTTEAINLVAQCFGRARVRSGDEIVISAMEHHSNIVPWQLLCEQTGAVLRVVPIGDEGEFLFEAYEKLLGPRTRLVAVTHVSNALGTVTPLRRVIDLAHRHAVPVLVDGAQAVAHAAVDVQALDCDFYAFSGHKAHAPTGIGVLYGKEALLEEMPPYQSGGDMIKTVTFEESTWADLPYKFEAGTPNIAGAIALGAALDFVAGAGLEAIAAHEADLIAYASERVSDIRGLRIIGTAAPKAAILSFTLDGMHAHDIGTILDHHGVAVRTGHHCAMPVMRRFNVPATTRASFALYNTRSEIDVFVEALLKAKELFA